MLIPASVPAVVDVLHLLGADADPDAPPDLLVEVPHGADRTAHYDALRARLVSPLADDLVDFFHVNTDVGAWAYGERVAERLIAEQPRRSALLLRCLIPRTFIDCNRVIDAPSGDLTAGQLTAALPPYIRASEDHALLLDLHRAYVQVANAAYALVCGAGGLALLPHTYGPVTLGIAAVDDDIVRALHEAHEPDRYATWPLRAEVDLITTTPAGVDLTPEGLAEAVTDLLAKRGLTAIRDGAYNLHPSALGSARAAAWPGQTFCVEVRRDLLVPAWTPFAEMLPDRALVERVAEPLAQALADWFSSRSSRSEAHLR